MLYIHLKPILRKITKDRKLFLINSSGLTLGLTAVLLIIMYVLDEFSYDLYNQKADRIARVVLKARVNDEIINEAVTPAPVAATLKEEFPEVEEFVRLRKVEQAEFIYGNQNFRGSRTAYADPAIFKVFTLPFVKGDSKTALTGPNTMVITQKEAIKYFGTDDPLGKIIDFGNTGESLTITGVIEDIPEQSHFHFDILVSMEGLVDSREQNWMASHYFSYVLMKEGANFSELENKLPYIIEKYMAPQVEQMGMTYEKFLETGNEVGLFLQPLSQIHLHSEFDFQSELEPGGDIQLIYMMIGGGLFMLLTACINFINLSTASAMKRMSEISIKKIMGAGKGRLILQLYTETFMTAVFSQILALLMVIQVLPLFNYLTGKSLSAAQLMTPEFSGSIILLMIIVTLLAGSYPALFHSSVSASSIVIHKNKQINHGSFLRKALIIFQFIVSSSLIFAIIIINLQINFIQSKDIGYDRNQLLVIRDIQLPESKEESFRNKLISDSRIENVTRTAYIPAGPSNYSMTNVFPGEERELVRRTIVYSIDPQYIPTMKMEILEGRNFTESVIADTTGIIINETAVRSFKLGENPLGKSLTIHSGTDFEKEVSVIGILKDFHYRPFREMVEPLIMVNQPYGGMIIRINKTETDQLIADITLEWNSLNPSTPFQYAFLDDLYNLTFQKENKTSLVLEILGVITVFVACLGLFGLVTFNTERRIREIGIRKVLGANIRTIVVLLTKDLVGLVIMSFLIAFPIGYYFMDIWLMDFVYKTEIPWWSFALSAMLTLSVAIITMSIKTWQAGRANPVEVLKYE